MPAEVLECRELVKRFTQFMQEVGLVDLLKPSESWTDKERIPLETFARWVLRKPREEAFLWYYPMNALQEPGHPILTAKQGTEIYIRSVQEGQQTFVFNCCVQYGEQRLFKTYSMEELRMMIGDDPQVRSANPVPATN